MEVFLYKDYIRCIHTLRLNALLSLAEESEEYILDTTLKEKEYSHDRFAKTILSNKEEVANLINQYIFEKEKITKESLIKYTNSYITKKYKAKEADIVYKLKNQDVFFLIEHQSSVDNNMPYRILNYCVDIMQESIRNKKIYQKTKYPIIVPIVIYTGNAKWKVTNEFKKKQIIYKDLEKYKINLKYNLIDINKITVKYFLKKATLFSYAMIIEKSKNKNELITNLKLIIKNEKDIKKLDELANIIIYLLDKTIEDKNKEELLEKIEKKVGENRNMSTFCERIIDERLRDVEKAMKRSKTKIIKNMLAMDLQDDLILKATDTSQEELEKIKNQKNKKSKNKK